MCGQRELWGHAPDRDEVDNEEDAVAEVSVNNPNNDTLCMWRLFQEGEGSLFLDYEFKYFSEIEENAEVVLFDFDPASGRSFVFEQN